MAAALQVSCNKTGCLQRMFLLAAKQNFELFLCSLTKPSECLRDIMVTILILEHLHSEVDLGSKLFEPANAVFQTAAVTADRRTPQSLREGDLL